MKNIIKILLVILCVLVICAAVLCFTNMSEDPIKEKGNMTIAVTGDVLLGSQVTPVLAGVNSPFEGVKDVLGSVDVLLINFENAATTSESAVKGDYPLKVDPSYVPKVKINDNTIAALANNHVFDYGKTGMKDTLATLKANNITSLGAGMNYDEAHKPVTIEKNGHKITILNYMDSANFAEYSQDVIPVANGSNPGYSAYDSALAKKQIKEARDNGSDFVLVFFHYGNEYHTSPNDVQVNYSHEVIDYGADAVLGSHPHVSQGIEMYKNKPIFYSLGDFVFYPLGDSNTYSAYFVKFSLSGEKCTATVYPVTISNDFPVYMNAGSGSSFLNSLSPLTKSLKVNQDGTGTLTFNLTQTTNSTEKDFKFNLF